MNYGTGDCPNKYLYPTSACTCAERKKPSAERAWAYRDTPYGAKAYLHCTGCGANWRSDARCGRHFETVRAFTEFIIRTALFRGRCTPEMAAHDLHLMCGLTLDGKLTRWFGEKRQEGEETRFVFLIDHGDTHAELHAPNWRAKERDYRLALHRGGQVSWYTIEAANNDLAKVKAREVLKNSQPAS